MIRKFKNEDIDSVMEIWLGENIKSHYFVDEKYWKNNYDLVKKMILEAEIYVYVEGQEIVAFLGLMDTYIAGIFVDSNYQSQGIGKELLDFAKSIKDNLSLEVYLENNGAFSFYKREKFVVKEKSIDESTGESEYFMIWENK